MSADARALAAAVARSRAGQRPKPLRADTAGAVIAKSSYLSTLKARRAQVGVWELRGKVFARVMAYARDARLAGAEIRILNTVALQLMQLGRTKGMMTVESLAEDCMVTPRTVRNALRTLQAQRFITVAYRDSGQMTLRLDARFGPRAPVPGDKSGDNSKRRCAPRKKISTKVLPLRSRTLKNNDGNYAAPNGGRRESPAKISSSSTANGERLQVPQINLCRPMNRKARRALQRVAQLILKSVTVAGYDVSPKRAPPVSSG